MTKEELEKEGWVPQLCRVGTLFFKGNFFCRIKDDKVIVFNVKYDMTPLGEAETFEDIKKIQMKSDLCEIALMSIQMGDMMKEFEKTYGVKPDEELMKKMCGKIYEMRNE